MTNTPVFYNELLTAPKDSILLVNNDGKWVPMAVVTGTETPNEKGVELTTFDPINNSVLRVGEVVRNTNELHNALWRKQGLLVKTSNPNYPAAKCALIMRTSHLSKEEACPNLCHQCERDMTAK